MTVRSSRVSSGRAPRAFRRVVVRCPYGAPAVTEQDPYDADGEPFPTTYYLTCPHLVAAIARIEAAGGVERWSDRVAADEALAASLARATEEHEDPRRELAAGRVGRDDGAVARSRHRRLAIASPAEVPPRSRGLRARLSGLRARRAHPGRGRAGLAGGRVLHERAPRRELTSRVVAADVESARRDWEDAYRASRRSPGIPLAAERLRLQLEVVSDELRQARRVARSRSGSSRARTTDADVWVRDVVGERAGRRVGRGRSRSSKALPSTCTPAARWTTRRDRCSSAPAGAKPRRTRRPRRRLLRPLASRWRSSLVFLVGVAFGQALDDAPGAERRDDDVRTLEPLPQEPPARTVTVTVTAAVATSSAARAPRRPRAARPTMIPIAQTRLIQMPTPRPAKKNVSGIEISRTRTRTVATEPIAIATRLSGTEAGSSTPTSLRTTSSTARSPRTNTDLADRAGVPADDRDRRSFTLARVPAREAPRRSGGARRGRSGDRSIRRAPGIRVEGAHDRDVPRRAP